MGGNIMQSLVAGLASLAVIPVVVFGVVINTSALWSLVCVALIAGSLYTMFSPGDSNDATV